MDLLITTFGKSSYCNQSIAGHYFQLKKDHLCVSFSWHPLFYFSFKNYAVHVYNFGSTAKLNLIYFVEWINKFFESLKSIVALNNYWGINLNMKVDVGRNNRYESNDIKTKEQSTYYWKLIIVHFMRAMMGIVDGKRWSHANVWLY